MDIYELGRGEVKRTHDNVLVLRLFSQIRPGWIHTPGIRPNASGAATVSPDGKQVGKNFITNLIIIIKVCYLLYIL